jgi:hypothetical protein
MVQLPAASPVTVVPLTEQVDAVCEEKLAASRDVDVALTVAVPPTFRLAGAAPKVSVWVALLTLKLWVTAVAGEYLLSPA